jgi:hypothetical protein
VKAARENWFGGQDGFDPERLIFIDESGLSTKMARLRGWAPIRAAADSMARSRLSLAVVAAFKPWVAVSALPAEVANVSSSVFADVICRLSIAKPRVATSAILDP